MGEAGSLACISNKKTFCRPSHVIDYPVSMCGWLVMGERGWQKKNWVRRRREKKHVLLWGASIYTTFLSNFLSLLGEEVEASRKKAPSNNEASRFQDKAAKNSAS